MRGENLGKANFIATKIFYQHVIDITFFTNVSIEILGAAENVNEALTFKEVIIVPTFEAGPSIRVSLDTLADVQCI
jgi:hypothetical protein